MRDSGKDKPKYGGLYYALHILREELGVSKEELEKIRKKLKIDMYATIDKDEEVLAKINSRFSHDFLTNYSSEPAENSLFARIYAQLLSLSDRLAGYLSKNPPSPEILKRLIIAAQYILLYRNKLMRDEQVLNASEAPPEYTSLSPRPRESVLLYLVIKAQDAERFRHPEAAHDTQTLQSLLEKADYWACLSEDRVGAVEEQIQGNDIDWGSEEYVLVVCRFQGENTSCETKLAVRNYLNTVESPTVTIGGKVRNVSDLIQEGFVRS